MYLSDLACPLGLISWLDLWKKLSGGLRMFCPSPNVLALSSCAICTQVPETEWIQEVAKVATFRERGNHGLICGRVKLGGPDECNTNAHETLVSFCVPRSVRIAELSSASATRLAEYVFFINFTNIEGAAHVIVTVFAAPLNKELLSEVKDRGGAPNFSQGIPEALRQKAGGQE